MTKIHTLGDIGRKHLFPKGGQALGSTGGRDARAAQPPRAALSVRFGSPEEHFGSPGVKSKPLESAMQVKSPANYKAKMKSFNLKAVEEVEKIYFEACGYSMDRKKEFVRMFNKGLDNKLDFEDRRVDILALTGCENLLRFILAFLELVDEKDMEDSQRRRMSKFRTQISNKVWERESD